MQTPPSSSFTWPQIAITAASVILASGATYLASWFSFRKLKPEVRQIDSQSDLNIAQTRHLELQDNLTAGELLSRIFQQLYEANKRSDQLLADLEAAKREIARIPEIEQRMEAQRIRLLSQDEAIRLKDSEIAKLRG